jgi:predicted nucleic acid-binding protein
MGLVDDLRGKRVYLELAARMRAADTHLRMPDAIHLASAQLAFCEMLLTNDNDLKGVPGVPPVLLSG